MRAHPKLRGREVVSVKQRIDEIAKAIVLTDAEDLPGLVALQEQLKALCAQADASSLAGLAEVAASAAGLIEALVLREREDVEATFRQVQRDIEQLQNIVDAVEHGVRPADPSGSVHADASPAQEIDEDLLTTWLAGCCDVISDLEATVVELDSADDPSENIAEARRGIHTLKGEAGVLSLQIAQNLCHEAESLIDARTEAGEAFPVDDILALLDWLKAYAARLAADPHAQPPEHQALLARLSEDVLTEPATGDDSAPEPPHKAVAHGHPDHAEPPTDVVDDDGPVTFPDDLALDENLNDFLCEAREHIENAEEALLELERDVTDAELLNTVFRAFHTIKGVAGFMHLTAIVELAHTAETLLDFARTGQITLNSAYLDLVLQSCDLLSQLIAGLEGAAAPGKHDLAHLIDRLKNATVDMLDESTPPPPEQTPDPTFHPLGEIIVGLGLATDDQIEAALRQQNEGALHLRSILIETDLTDVESVEDALVKRSDTGRVIAERLVTLGFVDEETLARAIEAKENSSKRLGEQLGLTTKQIASALHKQRQQRREHAAPAPTGPTAKSPAAKRRTEQTVKVSTTRMDNLVTMVGELVIAQQMVVQDPVVRGMTDQKLQRNLGHVGKIIRDLQEVAMSLRMVTIKGTFQKMARLVRDISIRSGKKIIFFTEGEDTELDRNVVEEIGDPLVHMIRNSCDHGIEPGDERLAAGKPEAGTLTLRAYHQGGSIVIETQDDGRGLDREKILAKALERGLISSDRDPASIPDDEVHNLVFQPGFSTADKVTDISGRGVGMDVVRRNIEALRGKIDITSIPGQGSTFSMRLPLTMAIIDGMVVRVGTQRYVVPTLNIEQSFRPDPAHIHTAINRGEMAVVRGDLLPIYRLNRVFNLKEGADRFDHCLLIVLESNNARCCLMVDEILGQQQVVIKSLGEAVQPIRGVSGGAILGDGRVALILDVAGLVAEATTAAA